MSSPDSHASWRREHDARGVCTLWFDQPGRSFNLLDRPAIDELESHLADLEAKPAIAGLHHPQRQARRLLRGRRPPRDRLAARPRPRSSTCSAAGSPSSTGWRTSRSPPWRSSMAPAWAAAWSWRWPAAAASRSPRRRPCKPGCPRSTSAWSPPGAASPGSPAPSIARRRSTCCSPAGRSGISARGRWALSTGWSPRRIPHRRSTRARRQPLDARRDSGESWEDILERARDRLDDQPGSFPEVQERILSIVQVNIEHGQEAAQEAAVQAFAELAVSPETRESIAWFFQRKRVPSLH